MNADRVTARRKQTLRLKCLLQAVEKVSDSHRPKPPLCKGRWQKFFDFCRRGCLCKLFYKKIVCKTVNPSVSFADSSLYTREPKTGFSTASADTSFEVPAFSFYLLNQVLWDARISMGKISSLPASISAISTSLDRTL